MNVESVTQSLILFIKLLLAAFQAQSTIVFSGLGVLGGARWLILANELRVKAFYVTSEPEYLTAGQRCEILQNAASTCHHIWDVNC